MHALWKVLVIVALVLSIPSFIWFVKELMARSKANA